MSDVTQPSAELDELQARVLSRLTLLAGLAEHAGLPADDVMAALTKANAVVLSGAADVSTLRAFDAAWDAAVATSKARAA